MLAHVGSSVSRRSRQMSLVLGIFVSMVVVGAGLAVIVSTRRSRQLIKVLPLPHFLINYKNLVCFLTVYGLTIKRKKATEAIKSGNFA